MKIDPDDMAFPMPPVYDAEAKRMIPGYVGMTIRTWLAGQALAGLCTDTNQETDWDERTLKLPVAEALVIAAVQLADDLIAELNRETTP